MQQRKNYTTKRRAMDTTKRQSHIIAAYKVTEKPINFLADLQIILLDINQRVLEKDPRLMSKSIVNNR